MVKPEAVGRTCSAAKLACVFAYEVLHLESYESMHPFQHVIRLFHNKEREIKGNLVDGTRDEARHVRGSFERNRECRTEGRSSLSSGERRFPYIISGVESKYTLLE